MVVDPGGASEDRVSSSDGWLIIATLHIICFRPSFVMREKSPVRSMLDYICGIHCCRVR